MLLLLGQGGKVLRRERERGKLAVTFSINTNAVNSPTASLEDSGYHGNLCASRKHNDVREE